MLLKSPDERLMNNDPATGELTKLMQISTQQINTYNSVGRSLVFFSCDEKYPNASEFPETPTSAHRTRTAPKVLSQISPAIVLVKLSLFM